MEVRFGDCVYRFAFPALPMVLFNHFRTVSVHTAYIPEAVQKITRFLSTRLPSMQQTATAGGTGDSIVKSESCSTSITVHLLLCRSEPQQASKS